MRLRISEHKLFKQLIDQSELNYEDFSFTKKSGWLTVKHASSGEGFRFHRKSTLVLEDNQFRNLDTFQIKTTDEELTSENMDDVLKSFGKWLGSIKT